MLQQVSGTYEFIHRHYHFSGTLETLDNGAMYGYMYDVHTPKKLKIILGTIQQETVRYWEFQSKLMNFAFTCKLLIHDKQYKGEYYAFMDRPIHQKLLSKIGLTLERIGEIRQQPKIDLMSELKSLVIHSGYQEFISASAMFDEFDTSYVGEAVITLE